MNTKCGETDDTNRHPSSVYYYAFREVRRNLENQAPEGGATHTRRRRTQPNKAATARC